MDMDRFLEGYYLAASLAGLELRYTDRSLLRRLLKQAAAQFRVDEALLTSRLEAWLHLVNVVAAGTADEGSGIRRGEFCASARFLARAWNWPRTGVQRFLRDLRAAKMIAPVDAGGDAKSAKTRLGHLAGHFAGQTKRISKRSRK